MITYLSMIQQLSKFLLIFRYIDKIDKIWNLSKIIYSIYYSIKEEIDKHTTVIIKLLFIDILVIVKLLFFF